MDQARGLDLNSDSATVVEHQKPSDSIGEAEGLKACLSTETGNRSVVDRKDVVVLGRSMEVDPEASAIVKVEALASEVVASPEEVFDEVGEIVDGDEPVEGGYPCVERDQDAVQDGSLDGYTHEGFVCSAELETIDASVDLNLEAPVAVAVEEAEDKQLEGLVDVGAVEGGAEEIRDGNEVVNDSVTNDLRGDDSADGDVGPVGCAMASGKMEMVPRLAGDKKLEEVSRSTLLVIEGVKAGGSDGLLHVENSEAEVGEVGYGNEFGEHGSPLQDTCSSTQGVVMGHVSNDLDAQPMEGTVNSEELVMVNGSGSQNLEVRCTTVPVKGVDGSEDLPHVEAVQVVAGEMESGNELQEGCLSWPERNQPVEGDGADQVADDGNAHFVLCPAVSGQEEIVGRSGAEKIGEAGSTAVDAGGGGFAGLNEESANCLDKTPVSENQTLGQSSIDGGVQSMNCTLNYKEQGAADGLSGDQNLEAGSTMESIEPYKTVVAEKDETEGFESALPCNSEDGKIDGGAAVLMGKCTSCSDRKQSIEHDMMKLGSVDGDALQIESGGLEELEVAGGTENTEEKEGVGIVEAAEAFSNVTAEGVEAEGMEGVPGIGAVHADAGDIGSGAAELTEEDMSLPDAKQSSENSMQLSQGLLQDAGILASRELEEADGSCGDLKEETVVMEMEHTMEAKKAPLAANNPEFEIKCLEGVKNSASLQAVEISHRNVLVEEDVSFLEKNQNVVNDAEGCGLSDVQGQVLECVPGLRDNAESHMDVSIKLATAAEILEAGLQGNISKATESDATGRGTEASLMSSIGSARQGDPEAIQGVRVGVIDPQVIGSSISGKEIKNPDTLLVDNSAICQPDLGSKDLVSADPIAMVENSEAEPVNENSTEQVLVAAKLDAGQAVAVVVEVSEDACFVATDVNSATIVGACSSSVDQVDKKTVMHKDDMGDHDLVVSDVVISESEKKQLVVEHPTDEVDTLVTSSSLAVETKAMDSGTLGEDLMPRRDMLMHDAKPSTETDEQKNSELPEIQIVAGQREEFVNWPPGENQDSGTCSVCPLVDGSPLMEHSLPGSSSSLSSLLVDPATSPRCQNMDMKSKVLKADTSGQDGACCQMEVLQGFEEGQTPCPRDHKANEVMYVGADGDHKEQVNGPQWLERADEQSAKQAEISGYENNEHASYFLPIKEKADISVSDLVWGKVRSHPWWPGQIFDSSDASEMALKHQKKENFLVAYFGDKTFAWCEESQLKPFQKYFSELENQSSSDAFICSVNEALGEVSRREELGMMCCCMPEEAYGDIQYQKVDNAGIREGICSSIIDRSQIVNNFQPDRLVEYVKTLAQFPRGGADRLELIIAQAQLRAFNHSKGHSELRFFFTGGGLVENDNNLLPVERFGLPPSDFTSMKGTFGDQESLSNEEDILQGNMRQKSLSELEDEEELFGIVNDGAGGFELEASGKLVSWSSGQKRKVVDFDYDGNVEGKKNKLELMGDLMPKAPSPTLNGSFKVGEFIRRAASHLTASPSILKFQGDAFQRGAAEADHMGVDIFSIDVTPYIPIETLRTWKDVLEELPSPTEMLSQLCLAATDPMKISVLSTIVDLFTDFRNSCCASAAFIERKHIEKMGGNRGRKRATDLKEAYSETGMLDYMSDSYWSDVISYNSNEEEPSSSGLLSKEARMRGRRKKRKPEVEQERSLAAGPALDSTRYPSIKQELVPERPIIGIGVKVADESTASALVLCFNKPESVPSETDLTRIFSRYGPLKETEREVLDKKNCAKVVFKKRADAERAFSCARKNSFFGPALTSYQLKSLPLTPKASSDSTPKDNMDATPTGGNSLEIPVAQSEAELVSDTSEIEAMG